MVGLNTGWCLVSCEAVCNSMSKTCQTHKDTQYWGSITASCCTVGDHGRYIPCLHGNFFKRRGGHNCCQISSDSSFVATISTATLCHIKGNLQPWSPKTKHNSPHLYSSPLPPSGRLASPPLTSVSLFGGLVELKSLCVSVCAPGAPRPVAYLSLGSIHEVCRVLWSIKNTLPS